MRPSRRLASVAVMLLFVVGCGRQADPLSSESQQDGVELTATVDRSTTRIADPVTVTVEVSADESIDLGPPEPAIDSGEFSAVDIGDVESEIVEGRRKQRRTCRFESYTAGRRAIPTFVVKYTAAGDPATAKRGRTLRSEPIFVRVASSVGLFADPRKFRDNIDVIDPPHGWVYWSMVIAFALVAVAAIVASAIRVARRLALPSTPAEIALRELDFVERRRQRDRSPARETIADVDAILRTFLQRVWRLPADQLTADELAWAAAGRRELPDGDRDAIRRLLRTADERKFAPSEISSAQLARTIAETREVIGTLSRPAPLSSIAKSLESVAHV